MTLKLLCVLAVATFSCACSKYKFNGETDGTRMIIPLSASEVDETLLDQFPCGKKSEVEVECHDPKVEICHVPPGNAEAAHTLCIARSAVKAHLHNHEAETGEADFLGDCEGSEQDTGIAPD